MSALYGFKASIPLTEAREAAVKRLEDALSAYEDVNMEEIADDEGRPCLDVYCPVRSMGWSDIYALDDALEALAQHAREGFALEYEYEGSEGVEFLGPSEEAVMAAKRRWHFRNARHHLELAGLDFDDRKVLVVIRGGTASAFAEPGVRVAIADLDSLEELRYLAAKDQRLPRGDEIIPLHADFKRLMAFAGIDYPAGEGDEARKNDAVEVLTA